jgi:hypothetical protein
VKRKRSRKKEGATDENVWKRERKKSKCLMSMQTHRKYWLGSRSLFAAVSRSFLEGKTKNVGGCFKMCTSLCRESQVDNTSHMFLSPSLPLSSKQTQSDLREFILGHKSIAG